MQPIPNRQTSPAVNWSIPGQSIDQFPAAVVVLNGPPFRGPLIACRPCQLHCPHPLPTPTGRLPAAVLGYAVAKPLELIARQKRHGSTTANAGASSAGGANVVP